jgi:hypothetical protein
MSIVGYFIVTCKSVLYEPVYEMLMTQCLDLIILCTVTPISGVTAQLNANEREVRLGRKNTSWPLFAGEFFQLVRPNQEQGLSANHPEPLRIYGAKYLKPLNESVNEVWNSAGPFNRPRPQPYYSMGFANAGVRKFWDLNYTDGEIFRQARLSQVQNDTLGSDRWLARLSQPKTRDLKALLKRDVLIKALDSILALRGLWGAFKLGSMDVFST